MVDDQIPMFERLTPHSSNEKNIQSLWDDLGIHWWANYRMDHQQVL